MAKEQLLYKEMCNTGGEALRCDYECEDEETRDKAEKAFLLAEKAYNDYIGE